MKYYWLLSTGSAAGTPVTITGTNFDMAGNSVTIGGTDCSVTSSTTTSIVCTLFAGPGGERDVKVHVPSKGWASGSVTFTFTTAVSSISPTSGSLLGGLLLVITGHGFSSDATVTIDGKTCAIESQSLTQIVCLVPPLETAVVSVSSSSVCCYPQTKVMPQPLFVESLVRFISDQLNIILDHTRSSYTFSVFSEVFHSAANVDWWWPVKSGHEMLVFMHIGSLEVVAQAGVDQLMCLLCANP